MAIVLEANYSKKLGLPQYSSHQYSVTVRTEVNDLSQIDRASSDLYRQLQEAVDRDIRNPGFLPGVENEPRKVVPFRRSGEPNGTTPHRDPEAWACSEKQRGLIEKLMREHSLSRDAVEELARLRFQRDLATLNKMQASGLIDELIEDTRSVSGNARRGGARK